MSDIAKKAEHILTKEEFRIAIVESEEEMRTFDNVYIGRDSEVICPLKHSFGDGIYVREIFNPKGALIITKIHKKDHPFFLLKGRMLIATEKGIQELEAPFQGMTMAGTKRAIYALEDVVFITVHATEKTNLDEIEDEIISESFDEFDATLKAKEERLCHG